MGLFLPLKMNFEKQMQLTEVTHLKFVLKARLQLDDHVHIAYKYDEVIYIYDYIHNVVGSLQNVQVIYMPPYKAFVCKEYVETFVAYSSG